MGIVKAMAVAALAVLSMAGSASQAAITYYHNDIAGSPLVATNEAGQVVWRESYRPYGERTVNAAAANANKVWFTSRRQDDSGLVYMGARYYDPVVGRFISTDPAGLDEMNLHSFNRYAYANNNPYKFNDPDGRTPALTLCAAGPLGCAAGLALTAAAAYYTAEGIKGTARALAIYNESKGSDAEGKSGDSVAGKSPQVEPSEVAGKTPQEIDALAREKGLRAKGPDPANGKGSYVDPVTGEQRILVHPTGKGGGHAHVNDPSGQRLDAGGNVVSPESPAAHLPLGKP